MVLMYPELIALARPCLHLRFPSTSCTVYLEHYVQEFWGLFKQKRDSCFFSRQTYVTHSGSESVSACGVVYCWKVVSWAFEMGICVSGT